MRENDKLLYTSSLLCFGFILRFLSKLFLNIMADSGTSSKQPHLMEIMNQMCRDLGINECEPQLLLQMCDIAYSLTKNVLLEARSVAEFNGKKFIERTDVDFALKSFNEKFCKDRPPIALMTELAAEKNAQPLPQIRQNYGLRLPNDRFCQLQQNFIYADLPLISTDKGDENDVQQNQQTTEAQQSLQKREKPESSNNFNPDLVTSLLMGRQNVASNGSRKRAFPDDEKAEQDDFDDYDC